MKIPIPSHKFVLLRMRNRITLIAFKILLNTAKFWWGKRPTGTHLSQFTFGVAWKLPDYFVYIDACPRYIIHDTGEGGRTIQLNIDLLDKGEVEKIGEPLGEQYYMKLKKAA